jgi:large subunit ribosomal protein L10
MASQLKQFIVDELASRYKSVNDDNCVVFGFQGINAIDANHFRKSLREKRIRFNVVKNSSAALALKKVDLVDIEKLIEGPTAIAMGGDDPASLAKGVKEWTKKVPAIQIKGGYVDGRLFTQQEIEVLASLPSREELLAQILGGIKTPMVMLANVFSASLRNLVVVLQAIKDQKQQKEQ